MDEIWDNLDAAFDEAYSILEEKQRILQQAHAERHSLLEQAHQEAEQIKNQTRIVQQARQEAAQIQTQTQQECDESRRATWQEIQQLRQKEEANCEKLRREAEDYAASVLVNLENDLKEMLKVTRNGRATLDRGEAKETPEKSKPKRKAS